MPLESVFKTRLIKRIETLYPGAVILKNDANRLQGFPDHLILYQDHWAAFEAKRSILASHRLNQDYWVAKLDKMSLCRFVSPENEREFLDELHRSFKS